MVYWKWSVIAVWLAVTSHNASSFAPLRPAFVSRSPMSAAVNQLRHPTCRFSTEFIIISFDDDDDDGEEDEEEEDDEEEEENPYAQAASSEFVEEESGLATPTTNIDWGGALGTLRDRIDDQEKGLVGPSNALFRTMTSQSPNEAIGSFVAQANPQVVQAMSGAVSSLLGGLSSPAMGVETVVKASGEKIGSLCFQLQMTGYMFRNAEYVLALKDLMNLRGSATLQDYKDAFDRLDADQSGYIESGEIEALLSDVYGDDGPPAFEVESFMRFFDANDDGRISWQEFERGLGAVAEKKAAMALQKNNSNQRFLSPQENESEDEDEEVDAAEPTVSGKVEVELKDGKVIEVEAKDYIEDLKREAEALKEALRRESGQQPSSGGGLMPGDSSVVPQSEDTMEGIASYIASLQGDVQSLTKGISPEVVEAMKLLVDYVIEGGPSKKKQKENAPDKEQVEMEIPGSALQQLALWQLVIGYRLRESEATGEYLRLLE